jgi:hypothetical protein
MVTLPPAGLDLLGEDALIGVGAHKDEWGKIVTYIPALMQYRIETSDGSRDMFQRNEFRTRAELDQTTHEI